LIIDRPIFIIGIQRSGTTILNKFFTRHKDTAFFENFSSRYYRSPWKFKFIPILLKLQKLKYGPKFRPKSNEGRVWRRFFTEIDYLDESKVTVEIKNYYYSAIKTELRAFKGKRFANKNPADCLRLRWINAMFPDAYYILIWRDPKAVVNSIYQKMQNQWENDLITEYEHGYHGYVTVKEKFGKDVSKLESCINYYNYLKIVLLKDLNKIKRPIIELRYENFVKRPRDELKKLYEFTDLDWYDDLSKDIPETLELINNEKWKKLSDKERHILENAFP